MTIDRIGSIDPIQNGKKTDRVESTRQKSVSDAVSVSSEAAEKADLYHAIELVSQVNDLRMDKIAELKQKINDPSYINEKVLTETANKIIDSLGL
jgi:negative regulator of flagellin synthesis FlgM